MSEMTGKIAYTEYEGEKSLKYPGKTTARGTVVKVLSEKENWALILVSPFDKKDLYKASGCLTGLVEGLALEMEGEWTFHPQYGRSFKVTDYNIDVKKESSREVVESILRSKMFKGIGKRRAQKIYDTFRQETLDVVLNHPERLYDVKGLGKKQIENLVNNCIANSGRIKLAAYLKPEASDNEINHFIDIYGNPEKTLKALKENPYDLIGKVGGIGFVKADKLAIRSFGFALNDPRRIDAAILYAIDSAGTEGHCYVPIHEVVSRTKRQIGNRGIPVGFTEQEIIDRYAVLKNEKKIMCVRIFQNDTSDIGFYTKDIYEKEVRAAEIISQMGTHAAGAFRVTTKDIQIGIERTEKQYEKEYGIKFSFEKMQKEAVERAFDKRLTVITGGPGTGKSTCLRGILNSFLVSHSSDDVLLCAPTGRAASRMRELTHVSAMTIHRAMAEHETYKLVIADEMSMADIHVLDMLLSLVSSNGRLIMIGDPDQLPSVGPGNVLNDIIDSGKIPVVKLEVIYRNCGSIAKNAAAINSGEGVEALQEDENFEFQTAYQDDVREMVLRKYYQQVEKWGVEEVCLIAPIRKPGFGQTSVYDLNLLIRDKLNPGESHDDTGHLLKARTSSGVVFRAGDRVMLTKNMKDVCERMLVNGDTGVVLSVTDKTVVVKFDDPAVVTKKISNKNNFNISGDSNTKTVEELQDVIVPFERGKAEAEFILAYACTVHKSQGQEYKSVIFTCSKEHYHMLERNLVYTAITRAKKQCTIIGDPNCVTYAAKTVTGKKRYTLLKSRIIKNCQTC